MALPRNRMVHERKLVQQAKPGNLPAATEPLPQQLLSDIPVGGEVRINGVLLLVKEKYYRTTGWGETAVRKCSVVLLFCPNYQVNQHVHNTLVGNITAGYSVIVHGSKYNEQRKTVLDIRHK